jgi:predicted enzyme related to lactoylglutathione lyase
MEMDRYEHGVPSWVDLGTPDPAAARAFYRGLFGWQVEEGPPEAGGYAIASLRDRPVAGIGPQMNPGPPAWSTYVNVDSADDVVAEVGAAGGQVFMEPMDVMTVGRMSFFADPVGGVIGVWEPRDHKGAGVVNEHGTYTWSELVAPPDDLDKAIAFYGAVFGWGAKKQGPPGQPPAYVEWQVGGRSIAGMMPKPPMMPAEVPPYWGVYFAVDDPDATTAQATKTGGSVIVPPMDIEPGRFSTLADPTGAVFSVIRMNEQA